MKNAAPRGYKVVWQIVQTGTIIGDIVIGQFAKREDAEMCLGTSPNVHIRENTVRV